MSELIGRVKTGSKLVSLDIEILKLVTCSSKMEDSVGYTHWSFKIDSKVPIEGCTLWTIFVDWNDIVVVLPWGAIR